MAPTNRSTGSFATGISGFGGFAAESKPRSASKSGVARVAEDPAHDRDEADTDRDARRSGGPRRLKLMRERRPQGQQLRSDRVCDLTLKGANEGHAH